MKIYIEKEDKHLELKMPRKGIEVLNELKINPSTVILVKNDEVVLEDEIFQDQDEMKILSVISGG